MDALVELGLARAKPGHSDQLVLPDPMVAVGALIEKVEDEVLRQVRTVADTRAELPRLVTLAGGALDKDAGASLDRIVGLQAVRERLEELAFFARTSVFSIQPGGPQSAEALRASESLDERALRRQLDMRVVYDVAVLDDADNVRRLERLLAGGGQIRTTQTSLSRMIVIDELIAVVPIEPLNSERGALIVREPGLVSGFLRLFRSTWNEAEVFQGSISPADKAEATAAQISIEDQVLLRLLATGCTDETAARQIGMSVRHLRRRMARLMEELGAASRFEAGVEAAHRSWI